MSRCATVRCQPAIDTPGKRARRAAERTSVRSRIFPPCMKVGLENLIAPELAEYLDEVREFNAAAEARGGYWPEPDLLTLEGLREARERRAGTGPAPVELVAEAAGRRVPVRVLEPASGTPQGVFLEIHGGGFYM